MITDPWRVRTLLLPLTLYMFLCYTWALNSGYNFLPMRDPKFIFAFQASQLVQVTTMLTLLSYVAYEAIWVAAVILHLFRRSGRQIDWDPGRILEVSVQTEEKSQYRFHYFKSLRVKKSKEAKVKPKSDIQRAAYCIHFVSELTEIPNRYLTFPFIVLMFFFVSQSTDFEGWAWTGFRMAIAASLFLVCILPAFLMRFSAIYLRSLVLRNFESETIDEAVTREPPRSAELISNLRTIRRGAYAPLVNQPLVYAILTPIGGLGSFALIKLFLDALVG